jgi:hypothetical protein
VEVQCHMIARDKSQQWKFYSNFENVKSKCWPKVFYNLKLEEKIRSLERPLAKGSMRVGRIF